MGKRRHRHHERETYPKGERAPVRLCDRIQTPGAALVKVFVEGYEDVAFWRGIFDEYESHEVTFEIAVPPRRDLAKGKKVLLNMVDNSSERIILCMDSDFDYLFGDSTEQSTQVNNTPYLFHTYAYSTENFLCYAPSLHKVCVKATKNDRRIFDFEKFLADYSRTIYPLFAWYAFSAQRKSESFFTLIDFKSSVKLNYLELDDCGSRTLAWLDDHVRRRLETLDRKHEALLPELRKFKAQLSARGLQQENVYMFMQGHTLMDNVVMVMLHAVCDQLMMITNASIATSTKQGTALKNEQSNYNNSLRNVRDILLDNENYKDCFLYRKLKSDIDAYVRKLRAHIAENKATETKNP